MAKQVKFYSVSASTATGKSDNGIYFAGVDADNRYLMKGGDVYGFGGNVSQIGGTSNVITTISQANGKIFATADTLYLGESTLTSESAVKVQVKTSQGRVTGVTVNASVTTSISSSTGTSLTTEGAVKSYVDAQISNVGNIMTFKGVIDGGDTASLAKKTDAKVGDVWLMSDGKEYVYTTASAWELIGDQDTYIKKNDLATAETKYSVSNGTSVAVTTQNGKVTGVTVTASDWSSALNAKKSANDNGVNVGITQTHGSITGLTVTVSEGTITSGDTSVVTGDAVWTSFAALDAISASTAAGLEVTIEQADGSFKTVNVSLTEGLVTDSSMGANLVTGNTVYSAISAAMSNLITGGGSYKSVAGLTLSIETAQTTAAPSIPTFTLTEGAIIDNTTTGAKLVTGSTVAKAITGGASNSTIAGLTLSISTIEITASAKITNLALVEGTITNDAAGAKLVTGSKVRAYIDTLDGESYSTSAGLSVYVSQIDGEFKTVKVSLTEGAIDSTSPSLVTGSKVFAYISAINSTITSDDQTGLSVTVVQSSAKITDVQAQLFWLGVDSSGKDTVLS